MRNLRIDTSPQNSQCERNQDDHEYERFYPPSGLPRRFLPWWRATRWGFRTTAPFYRSLFGLFNWHDVEKGL